MSSDEQPLDDAIYYIRLQCPFVCLSVCMYPPRGEGDASNCIVLHVEDIIDEMAIMGWVHIAWNGCITGNPSEAG